MEYNILTLEDKIKFIDEKIRQSVWLLESTGKYIDLINSGMQDPDLDVDECEKIIYSLSLKIEVLNKEKQALTNLL